LFKLFNMKQMKMKQTLVIGSTVIDVLLNLPVLPRRGEDINLTAQEYRVGGCAYNVYKTLKLLKSQALLCSPVGTGVYGRMVREHFEKEGIQTFVSLEEENGCCYCLIEPDGERSFLSLHGAEYLFSPFWMKNIDFSLFDAVFICGLEVEEAAGKELIDFVYEHPGFELYFAPGPRIKQIPAERMERLLERRDKNQKGPFLHLNEKEALSFSNKNTVEEGAEFLAGKTGNSVVITLGQRGSYCLSKPGAAGLYISGFPVKALDTVGAGDAHCGALIACLKEGMDLTEACRTANKIGAETVKSKGERRVNI